MALNSALVVIQWFAKYKTGSVNIVSKPNWSKEACREIKNTRRTQKNPRDLYSFTSSFFASHSCSEALHPHYLKASEDLALNVNEFPNSQNKELRGKRRKFSLSGLWTPFLGLEGQFTFLQAPRKRGIGLRVSKGAFLKVKYRPLPPE